MQRIAHLAAVPLLLSGLAACAGADMAPFGRATAGVQEDSPTVRRVRGLEAETAPLTYEPGTVWPAPSAEPARALLPEDPPRPPVPARGTPRSEAPLPPPAATRLAAAAPAPTPSREPDRRLRVGTVLPGGVVVTGEGPLATTLSPQGVGLVRQEGPAAVLTGPDGEIRHVALPPR
ncbi:MAG: hypothetical protein ACK4PG_02530 [Acetobacteraceae bacterium]